MYLCAFSCNECTKQTDQPTTMAQPTLVPRLIMELLWWLITAVVAYLVLIPIYNTLNEHPYLVFNLVCVAVFITFTRYVFLLRYSFFSHLLPVKVFLVFGALPLFIYLMANMFDFQVFLNEHGVDGLFPYLRDPGNITMPEMEQTFVYFRREMLFFASSAIIITAILPVRMLISAWRVYNKTGKV